MQKLTKADIAIGLFDGLLQTIFPIATDSTATPGDLLENATILKQKEYLAPAELNNSLGLMRVNHSGEIAAQALYYTQALWSNSLTTQDYFLHAANEERQHLIWCSTRIRQLGGRESYFGPIWYFGASVIASIASLGGQAISLGFVVATENQVEQHLNSHLTKLPAKDIYSKKIVSQM